MNTAFLLLIIAIVPISVYSCGAGYKSDSSKINFELSNFTEDGMMIIQGTDRGYINYEFCIPAGDEYFKEVRSIDSTLGLYKNSKGRSACSDKEWLCIGSSHQKNFKSVIITIAKLSYVRQINQTFWE